MPGLSRFDFYPRDWLAGTRTLSSAAKGVYIDLLAVMYDRGEAIDHDPKWLCKLLGFRDARQLQPVLDELVVDRKIEIIDGKIHNRRADAEIEKARAAYEHGRTTANRRWSKSGKGAVRKTSTNGSGNGHQRGTSEAPAGDQQASTTLFPDDDFVENQSDSECSRARLPSPSPITPYAPLKPEDEPETGRRRTGRRQGTRISPDWRPTDADRAFAATAGFTAAEIETMAAEFVDFWLAATRNAAKADWSATWRNRCRERARWKVERAERVRYGTPDGDGSDMVQRILARKQREQHGGRLI